MRHGKVVKYGYIKQFLLVLYLVGPQQYSVAADKTILSHSPDKKSYVYFKTDEDTGHQRLYIFNNKFKKRRLLTDGKFRLTPKVVWHDKKNVEIVVYTGSPGRFSIFYNLKNNRKSEKLWFVIAFNRHKEIALLGGVNIELKKIYSNKKVKILKIDDIYHTAINFLVVQDAVFQQNNDLFFRYSTRTNKIKDYLVKYSEYKNLR